METKTVINAPDGSTQPIVVHQYEGHLPDPINYKKIELSGNIDAVCEFLKREHLAMVGGVNGKDDAIILVDHAKKTITLTVNEFNPTQQIKVVAKLVTHPALEKFGIETNVRRTPQELASLLRVNSMYFPNVQEHRELLVKLQRFTAKVNTAVEQSNDSRGNLKDLVDRTVETDLPESFTLEIPVYVGSPKSKFLVFICMEARDKGVSIWLESAELLEIRESQWESAIKAKEIEWRDSDHEPTIIHQ